MARPAESYRGARRNAWRAREPWTTHFGPNGDVTVLRSRKPWQAITVYGADATAPNQSRLGTMAPPRYVPYRCKPPRLRYGTFQVGTQPDAINDVMVPYTDLRKQPKVYK